MPNRISNIGSKLTLNFWLLGGWTTKIKVCLKLKLKNAKTSFKWFFWNFEISVKKSADFSCLFTFFQKYCKFMIISSTFWELHNCQLKLAICLHFGITTSVTDSIGHFIIFLKTLLIKIQCNGRNFVQGLEQWFFNYVILHFNVILGLKKCNLEMFYGKWEWFYHKLRQILMK